MFDYSPNELTVIDQQLDPLLQWAGDRIVQTQQLSMDASRLLSCTSNRLNDYQNKGFFIRCWYTLSGKTGAVERANQNDLIEMQRLSWRYLNLLQERDLMLAHTSIVIRNNLLALAKKEEETRMAITQMAERIIQRFESLEKRVDQLEVTSQIHSWLLTIDQRDYDEQLSAIPGQAHYLE